MSSKCKDNCTAWDHSRLRAFLCFISSAWDRSRLRELPCFIRLGTAHLILLHHDFPGLNLTRNKNDYNSRLVACEVSRLLLTRVVPVVQGFHTSVSSFLAVQCIIV